MDIESSLSLIENIGLYCATSFDKEDTSTLTIKKNLVASSATIKNGKNIIGKGNTYDQAYTLFGNNLVLRNLKVYKGNTEYINSIDYDSTYSNVDFENIQNEEFSISECTAQLSGYSDYLRTLDTTGNVTYSGGSCYFSGSDDVNIINISSDEVSSLNSSDSFDFDFPSDSIVIVNILGSNSVLFADKAYAVNNVALDNIIFNFQTNPIIISGGMYFHCLAINSTITITSATINSQLISNNISLTGTTTSYLEVFTGYSSLPTETLDAPTITSDSSSYVNSTATITISGEGTIYYYTSKDSTIIEYISEFNIDDIGTTIIYAYSSKNGYITSDTTEFSVTITCTTANVVITYDSTNKLITLESATSDSTIYFNIDGSSIEDSYAYSVSNGGTYSFTKDGGYQIVARAYNEDCGYSGVSYLDVYLEFDEYILTISTTATEYSDGLYYNQNNEGILITIACDYSPIKIYYTEDGTNPYTNGTLYSGPFYSKGTLISAVCYTDRVGVSDIFTFGPFNVMASEYIDASSYNSNSELKDTYSSYYAKYGEDCTWIGPHIIVDDNTVYQGLVSILSVGFIEIPFRHDFGTSLKTMLFSLDSNLTSDYIISQLKSEIEYNDPRIDIQTDTSYAEYSDGNNALKIELDWKNKITGDIAHIRYDFTLDGILS